MDVMELRKRLMQMAVANGAEYVKGTFTVPADIDSDFTLSYGKSFNKYLLYIEMTDASKTALENSGTTNATAILYLAVYPAGQITNQYTDDTRAIKVATYNPSNKAFATTTLGGTLYSTSSFTDSVKAAGASGTTRLVKGYSYNYVIVSLDDI